MLYQTLRFDFDAYFDAKTAFEVGWGSGWGEKFEILSSSWEPKFKFRQKPKNRNIFGMPQYFSTKLSHAITGYDFDMESNFWGVRSERTQRSEVIIRNKRRFSQKIEKS